jgi:hypothetical protein
VAKVLDRGIEVTIKDNVAGFIRKTDLSRDRSEQRPDRFAVGEKFDAKVTTMDRATNKFNLSIKAREIDEEKRAMADYGSSDSGASLGEILGAAIRSKQEAGDQEEEPVVEKAPAVENAPAVEKTAAPKKAEEVVKKAKAPAKAKTAKPKAKKKTEADTEGTATAKEKTAGKEAE